MSRTLVIPTEHGDLDRGDSILGRGAFSIVYRGKFRNEEVAVKRIEIDRLPEERTDGEENAMQHLSHQNVLKLFHVQDHGDFRYFVLELCAGTLSDYCKDVYKDQMPSPIDCLLQMAWGLQYIHSKQYAHRDIKPANILISIGSPVCLKISDFGLSKPTTASGTYSLSLPSKGTENYMAPEILGADQTESPRPRGNTTSDVFSLGCVFFVYLTKGNHPFGNKMQITLNIINGTFNLSEIGNLPKTSALIEIMISKDPQQRPQMFNVVNELNSEALRNELGRLAFEQ